jgi:hypothetical protein
VPVVGLEPSCVAAFRDELPSLLSRRALHVAQVLRMATEHGPSGPPGDRPERLYRD